ncbi:hypothetical protein [Duganella sp. LjRoot269]|uniref:hypothetical protein n=1 Tax=Duganella sp. LjRoot269 TaxID=3342305 RepID=UPI003ED0812E
MAVNEEKMFHLSILVTLSGRDFRPSPEFLKSSYLEKSWKPGDFSLPGGRGREFDDTGVIFRVLDRCDQYDWEILAISTFREVCEIILREEIATVPVTPLVSIRVATDGADYPPLYLGRELMGEIERLKAEIDIDIIASL